MNIPHPDYCANVGNFAKYVAHRLCSDSQAGKVALLVHLLDIDSGGLLDDGLGGRVLGVGVAEPAKAGTGTSRPSSPGLACASPCFRLPLFLSRTSPRSEIRNAMRRRRRKWGLAQATRSGDVPVPFFATTQERGCDWRLRFQLRRMNRRKPRHPPTVNRGTSPERNCSCELAQTERI